MTQDDRRDITIGLVTVTIGVLLGATIAQISMLVW